MKSRAMLLERADSDAVSSSCKEAGLENKSTQSPSSRVSYSFFKKLAELDFVLNTKNVVLC